jgi:hypothetical protein
MGSMVRCNDVVIQIAIQCARTEMRLLTVPDMGLAHCHALQATPRTSGSLRGANQSVDGGAAIAALLGWRAHLDLQNAAPISIIAFWRLQFGTLANAA